MLGADDFIKFMFAHDRRLEMKLIGMDDRIFAIVSRSSSGKDELDKIYVSISIEVLRNCWKLPVSAP